MEKHKAETLVRTGPGTRMGNLLRRYWVPVLLSREIAEPDGPQVRVQILGEKTSRLSRHRWRGRPHRRVLLAPRGFALFRPQRGERHPLRLSRPEILALPANASTFPRRRTFAANMGIKAYPCIERGGRRLGLYGAAATRCRPPPEVEWCTLPASHVFVSKRLQECNYLQAMEGGIDTSHVSYVHRFEVDDDPMHRGCKANDYIKADGNVIFEIEKIGLRPHALRAPQRRAGLLLLAHHPVAVPLVHADSAVRRACARRPCLGADRRRALLGVEHQLPPRQAAVRRGAQPHGGGPGHPLPIRARHLPRPGEQGQRLPDRPPGAAGETRLQRRVRHRGAGRLAAGEHGPDPGSREREASAAPTARS